MRGQRGSGVAELLVALMVGLLVVLAATSLLFHAHASYAAHSEAAAMDDAARQSMEVIARAVRQSAFVNWEREHAGDAVAPVRISGLDARTLGRSAPGTSGAVPGAPNGSDVLALRFAGSGSGPDGDGSALSCAGFGVGQQDDGWSIFYVALNGEGHAELRCKFRGKSQWSSDALVGGVDGFQVLYGLDTDLPGDGLPNVYLRAGAIDALDAGIALEGSTEAARQRDWLRKTHWKRVASVRLALLLHGGARARNVFAPRVFDLFGTAYVGAGDEGVRVDEAVVPEVPRRRERRLFGTTIMLRNSAS